MARPYVEKEKKFIISTYSIDPKLLDHAKKYVKKKEGVKSLSTLISDQLIKVTKFKKEK